MFPVIDTLRLAVKIADNNKEISLKYGMALMDKLKHFVSGTCKVLNNMLVSFRTLCNLFAHPYGEEIIFKNRIELLENITSLKSNNKNIQVGLNEINLYFSNI